MLENSIFGGKALYRIENQTALLQFCKIRSNFHRIQTDKSFIALQSQEGKGRIIEFGNWRAEMRSVLTLWSDPEALRTLADVRAHVLSNIYIDLLSV